MFLKKERVFEKILNFGRSEYINACITGIGCCLPSINAVKTARFDIERTGIKIINNIENCDLFIICGYINHKYADKILDMYNRANSPKTVIAVGNCACSGGIYSESEEIIKGLDSVIPVDVYVPGCPPRPEGILNGILKLKDLVKNS